MIRNNLFFRNYQSCSVREKKQYEAVQGFETCFRINSLKTLESVLAQMGLQRSDSFCGSETLTESNLSSPTPKTVVVIECFVFLV